MTATVAFQRWLFYFTGMSKAPYTAGDALAALNDFMRRLQERLLLGDPAVILSIRMHPVDRHVDTLHIFVNWKGTDRPFAISPGDVQHPVDAVDRIVSALRRVKV